MSSDTQNTALATHEAPQDFALSNVSTNTAMLVLDEANLVQMERLAKMMATGRSTIPDHLKGSQGDCMAIVMQAVQWKMNPYAVAQKTHLVNGILGYEAQLVNAVINSMAPTKDRIHYEWFGPWEKIIGKFDIRKNEAKGTPGTKDYKKASEYRVPGWSMKDEEGLGVTVWATLKGEEEPRKLDLLLSQASVRNSPLWATDPKQQLAYLAVKRWSRLYCPDVILGVYTPDEFDAPAMKDINEAPRSSNPVEQAKRKQQAQQPGPSEELLRQARDAADKGTGAFGVFWKGIKPADRGALRNEVNDLGVRCKQADDFMQQEAERKAREDAARTIDPAEVDDFVKDMDQASGYVPE